MHTEYKKCRCGYSILVYVQNEDEGVLHCPNSKDEKVVPVTFRIFIDGMSGHYEQTIECPGCHDYIEYIMLEDDTFN